MKSAFIRPGRSPLVGARGMPLLPERKVDLPNEVHVIVVRPNGEQSLFSILRGEQVYWRASAFIAKGGRYVGEITPQNDVRLSAIVWHDNLKDWIVIAEAETSNDDRLREAIDRLVVASVENMDKKLLVVTE